MNRDLPRVCFIHVPAIDNSSKSLFSPMATKPIGKSVQVLLVFYNDIHWKALCYFLFCCNVIFSCNTLYCRVLHDIFRSRRAYTSPYMYIFNVYLRGLPAQDHKCKAALFQPELQLFPSKVKPKDYSKGRKPNKTNRHQQPQPTQ